MNTYGQSMSPAQFAVGGSLGGYLNSPDYAREQESLRRRVAMIQQQEDYQIEARMLAAQQGLEGLKSGRIQTISPLGNAFRVPHGSTEDNIRNLR